MKKPISWALKEARLLAAEHADTDAMERCIFNGAIDDTPAMVAFAKHIARTHIDPFLVAARQVVVDCYSEAGAPCLGALAVDYLNGNKDSSLEVRAAYRAILHVEKLPS